MKSLPKQKIIMILAVLYMAATTALAIKYYDLYKRYEAKVPMTEKEAEKEIATIIPMLKKIMEVPDEKPVIATVKDANALKSSQTFFAKAENGDKLVVFSQARKAVLYRPSKNKIVESGPLLVSPNNQQTNNQQLNPVKIAIYNGTTESGLGKEVEDKLKKAGGPVVQTSVATAKSTNYQDTIVVDLTGKNQQSASEVAKFLQGKVGELPATETRPDADILVILGATK